MSLSTPPTPTSATTPAATVDYAVAPAAGPSARFVGSRAGLGRSAPPRAVRDHPAGLPDRLQPAMAAGAGQRTLPVGRPEPGRGEGLHLPRQGPPPGLPRPAGPVRGDVQGVPQPQRAGAGADAADGAGGAGAGLPAVPPAGGPADGGHRDARRRLHAAVLPLQLRAAVRHAVPARRVDVPRRLSRRSSTTGLGPSRADIAGLKRDGHSATATPAGPRARWFDWVLLVAGLAIAVATRPAMWALVFAVVLAVLWPLLPRVLPLGAGRRPGWRCWRR